MTRKWIAVVEQPGQTTHAIGKIGEDGVEISHVMPSAARLEIVDEGDGVFMYRYDIDGDFCGDTCHPSVAKAMQQAKFEYGIDVSVWQEK